MPSAIIRSSGCAAGIDEPLHSARWGGALGGQIAATFVAASTLRGLPALTGFTTTFAMASLFLACCAAVALLIPSPAPLAAN